MGYEVTSLDVEICLAVSICICFCCNTRSFPYVIYAGDLAIHTNHQFSSLLLVLTLTLPVDLSGDNLAASMIERPRERSQNIWLVQLVFGSHCDRYVSWLRNTLCFVHEAFGRANLEMLRSKQKKNPADREVKVGQKIHRPGPLVGSTPWTFN